MKQLCSTVREEEEEAKGRVGGLGGTEGAGDGAGGGKPEVPSHTRQWWGAGETRPWHITLHLRNNLHGVRIPSQNPVCSPLLAREGHFRRAGVQKCLTFKGTSTLHDASQIVTAYSLFSPVLLKNKACNLR